MDISPWFIHLFLSAEGCYFAWAGFLRVLSPDDEKYFRSR